MAKSPSQWVVGIDFGYKNIGLAISVTEDYIVDPLKTVQRKDIWIELEKIRQEYNVKKIIIGLPLKENGSEDKITLEVRKFAKKVWKKFKIPVELWDERFSTRNAESIVKLRKKHSKKPIDHISAALILEEYLTEQETSPYRISKGT